MLSPDTCNWCKFPLAFPPLKFTAAYLPVPQLPLSSPVAISRYSYHPALLANSLLHQLSCRGQSGLHSTINTDTGTVHIPAARKRLTCLTEAVAQVLEDAEAIDAKAERGEPITPLCGLPLGSPRAPHSPLMSPLSSLPKPFTAESNCSSPVPGFCVSA